MLPLRDCRGYRSRYINALNRAVRSLTPIAGRGIRLRQSAQGVVIESTAKGGGAKASPFRHRWQVTATREVEPDGSASWTVNIRPGSVWTAAEDGAVADAALTPVAPVAPDAENGGWKVEGATSGSLYVALDDAGALLLKYGNPAAESAAVILRIADVAFTTGDPPSAVITQRQVGDERIGSGGSASASAPVAWTVAKRSKETSSGTAEQWQIFAPTWTVGRETLLPEGMEEDWNDLDVSSGDLYAVLSWTGTATTGDDGEVKTTWTPGKPIITNDLSSIPADEDPTPDDPSTSTIEGTEGHRSIIVKIGTFLTDDSGDAETPATIGFLQIHTGSIVEDINISASAPAGEEPVDNPAAWEVRLFEEEQSDGTKKKTWKVWSPTFTAGNQTIYAKTNNFEQTKNGWNRLLVPGSRNGLYAVLTMEGTVSGPYDGPGVVTWKVSNARIYFGSASNYYAYGKPPTREEPGIKEVAVLIGVFIDQEGASWSKFTQLHTGSIVVALRKDRVYLQDYDFYDEEPLHEDVSLPTAFAITEDGKLEISTRNAKIPIALNENVDKILLDLPSGGGSGNVDTLGPIEWDASRSAYVQYIGQWTWGGSAWAFERKKQATGADYPPAKVYPVTAADLLIRGRGGSSGTALTDDIKTLRFYLPFASASATSWLTKRETEVSNGVTYEPPESVDGNGQLKTGTFTLTYWSDTTPGRPSESTLLYTVVETANATSTYEG